MYGLRRDDSVILSIDRDETTIGRHTSNNIVINALPVSRHHSSIVRIDGRYFIKDKNTVNGTFIKKFKLLPERETLLKVGDIIGIGTKAGENSNCTFEVVLIQLDINKESENNETPNVVDSSSDHDQSSAQNHLLKGLEVALNTIEDSANKTKERISNIVDTNITSTSINSACVKQDQNEKYANESVSQEMQRSTVSNSERSYSHASVIKKERRTDPEKSIIYDVENPSSKGILCIDLSSDNDQEEGEAQKDIKPLLKQEAQYSTLDEIILLDSDDDDFPCSQMNATCIDDLTDFSDAFQSLYNDDKFDECERSNSLHCSEDMWFKPHGRKLIVDLPMVNHSRNACGDILDVCSSSTEGGAAIDHISKQNSKPVDFVDNSGRNAGHQSPKRHVNEDNDDSLLKPPNKKISSKYGIPAVEHKAIKVLDNNEVSDSKRKKKRKLKQESRKMSESPIKAEPKLKFKDRKIGLSKDKTLKERRKERLKVIATKNKSSSTTSKTEGSTRKVVAKLTKKNRSEILLDSMCNDPVATVNNPTYTELTVAPGCKERQNELFGFDSFLDDALDLCSQNIDEPTVPVQSTSKGSANQPASMERNITDESTGLIKHPPSRVAHKSNNKKSERNDNCTESKHSEHKKKMHISDFYLESKEKKSKKSLNHDADPIPEMSKCKIKDDKSKTNPPRLGFYVDQPTEKKSKKVQFSGHVPDYFEFDTDPEERRNNGTCAPRYKLSETVIKEELLEFESAIAVACNWNVKWLEEQKVILVPPPNLYVMMNNYPKNLPVPFKQMLKYKESLKEEMFFNLWKAIFTSYNKPDQDFLPHTQFVNDSHQGLYTLSIESVEVSRSQLWTISAYRNVDRLSMKDELINGQIVILNFHVKRKENQIPRKTMVFAYVASAHQVVYMGGQERQRIVFKIFQRDFEIIIDEAKIKVLAYTKTYLRPFQALAMMKESPVISVLANPECESKNIPTIPDEPSFIDLFLDTTQKSAVAMCLNNIALSGSPVSLVDGPPGSGKSQVVVSLVNELFSKARRHILPNDLRVLIITNSENVADDVAYRLEKRDNVSGLLTMNVLRYGYCKTINHKIKYCTLDEQIRKFIEGDEENGSLINLVEEERILLAKKNSFQLVLESEHATEDKKAEARLKLLDLDKEHTDLMGTNSRIKNQLLGQAAKDKAINRANVIVTSMNTCWSSNFENDFVPTTSNKGDVHKFTVCIFDDANYMAEVQMLIPIMLMVQSLVLVGDSKNVFHFKTKNLSPFYRLVREFEKKKSNAIIRLNFQHRMQPGIFKWFSGNFELACQPKVFKASQLVPMLVVNLKNKELLKLDDDTKWQKQADFCYRLALKINEIQPDVKITVIVVTEKEKEKLRQTIIPHVTDRVAIRVSTPDDVIGRENEIVLLCFPVKPCHIDRWLYLASSRARSSLLVCGYFENFLNCYQSVQWLVSDASINKHSYKEWDVDEDFPKDFLRSR